MKNIFKIPQAYAQTPEEIVGEIEVPRGVSELNTEVGGIGIVLFISNMIKFFLILGGIWVIINLIFAGFTYITGGGKSDTHTKVKDRITMSVLGLLLMIGAYSIAAIIGLVFYGSPTYIISPTITEIGP